MKKPFIIILLIQIFINIINSVPIDNEFNYCEALKAGLNFYKAQRAGIVDLESEFPWQHYETTQNDTYLNNLRDQNGLGYLSKGYFDAGDYVKVTFPLSFSMTALSWSFLEFKDNIEKCNLTNKYLQTIKVGIDWLMEAHPEPNVIYTQCGLKRDHDFWNTANEIYKISPFRTCTVLIDIHNPSTDIAYEMAAAMAAASLVFKDVNSIYSNKCKQHAIDLWNFGFAYRGIQFSDMYQSHGYQDEELWASAWLYKMDESNFFYRNFFEHRINKESFNGEIWKYMYSWDNKLSATTIFIAKNWHLNIKEAKQIINFWDTQVEKTNDGLFFIDIWGNTRYGLGGSLLQAMWYHNNSILSGIDKNQVAQTQINIILGNNSNHYSYVTEIGFKGAKTPKNLHHRSAHGSKTMDINIPKNNRYIIPGALVAGPLNKKDHYLDNRLSFQMNEPALDYNAVFVGVIASLINKNSKSVHDGCTTFDNNILKFETNSSTYKFLPFHHPVPQLAETEKPTKQSIETLKPKSNNNNNEEFGMPPPPTFDDTILNSYLEPFNESPDEVDINVDLRIEKTHDSSQDYYEDSSSSNSDSNNEIQIKDKYYNYQYNQSLKNNNLINLNIIIILIIIIIIF